MRRTKIIATLGPASDSEAGIAGLIAAGADIFRLNFSHGTHATHAATASRVRACAARVGRDVAILQDLGGPKIRTGALAGGQSLQVKTGEALSIATGDFVGGPGRLSTLFPGLARAVQPGNRLLLADGRVELRVEASDGREIRTSVVQGGAVGEHQGISAPGIPLPVSAITDKDIEDLTFGVTLGVDLVAISFVQSADDVLQARRLLHERGGADVLLVAKLERPQALEQLDRILAACDGVMVARGDLGLEMPFERVPRAQKAIIRGARQRGVPVIVATQVLESMTVSPRPTRAEVSDAANAVEDGVDAIMLADETAAGAFPTRAVETLDAIVRDAEEWLALETPVRAPAADDGDHAQALCEAAVTLASRGHAQALVAVTRGGSTARRLSALRPQTPIFATTDRPETARRLALYWGVAPLAVDIGESAPASGEHVGRQLAARGLVPNGAVVVFVSVSPDLSRPDANYLKLQRL